MNIRKSLLALLLLSGLFAAPVFADVNVFTCEPEWAALADELGGDKVESYSATTPFQDPHFIQARPSLIARVRAADLMVCSGAGLEIGWLPVLLRSARNEDVMPGNRGFLEATQYVQRLGVPGSVDRSAGDIHPYGNPHIQTDPRNIARVARELANRLKAVDPDNAAYYEKRFQDFDLRWRENVGRWTREAEALRGMQ
ncbi:MAG TPA: zinc ABC transporter substrate-binding protein, partial [Gammaproteobacteria bacterium]